MRPCRADPSTCPDPRTTHPSPTRRPSPTCGWPGSCRLPCRVSTCASDPTESTPNSLPADWAGGEGMVHAVSLDAGRAVSLPEPLDHDGRRRPEARRRADTRPAHRRRRRRCRQPHRVRHLHPRFRRWGTRLRAQCPTRHHPARRSRRRTPEPRRTLQGRPSHRRAPPPHLRFLPVPTACRRVARCSDADDPVDR